MDGVERRSTWAAVALFVFWVAVLVVGGSSGGTLAASRQRSASESSSTATVPSGKG